MADSFPVARHEPRARTRRRSRASSADTRLTLRTSIADAGVVVVTAHGEVDLANRASLAEALSTQAADPATRLLVCDLSGVSFLACTGVSVLLDAKARLASRDAALRVVATRTVVLRVLQVTDQHEQLGVCATLAEALAGHVVPPTTRTTSTRTTSTTLTHLRIALGDAVEQTSILAELCGRLAEEVSAVDAAALQDERGDDWHTGDTLTDMVEDLRVMQNHLTTSALLAAPTVEDLGHLRDAESSTEESSAG